MRDEEVYKKRGKLAVAAERSYWEYHDVIVPRRIIVLSP